MFETKAHIPLLLKHDHTNKSTQIKITSQSTHTSLLKAHKEKYLN